MICAILHSCGHVLAHRLSCPYIWFENTMDSTREHQLTGKLVSISSVFDARSIINGFGVYFYKLRDGGWVQYVVVGWFRVAFYSKEIEQTQSSLRMTGVHLELECIPLFVRIVFIRGDKIICHANTTMFWIPSAVGRNRIVLITLVHRV